MRGFFRFFSGVLFVGLFILLLITTAVKITLLSPAYWKNSFNKANLYTQVHTNLAQMMNTDNFDKPYLETLTDEQLSQLTPAQKQQFAGKTMRDITPPQGIALIESLQQSRDNITPQFMKELLETNIDRLLSYINGGTEKLLLFVPIEKLKLPKELANQPPLDQLGPQTDVAVLIGAISSNPENLLAYLESAKYIGTFVTAIWASLAFFAFLALIIYILLSRGKRSKVRGTSLLFAISGLLATILAFGPKQALITVLSAKQSIPPLLIDLLPQLVGGFMRTGLLIGILSAIAGTVLFVMAGRMEQDPKEKKAESEKPHGCLKLIIIIVVILVFIVVGLGFIGGLSNKSSGKGDFVGSVYVSQKLGWQITPPANWVPKQQGSAVGFFSNTPEKSQVNPTAIALISVEPSEKPPTSSVDEAYTQIAKFFNSNNPNDNRFKNASLNSNQSYYDQWQGYNRLAFLFDYDSPAGETPTRLRELRWYLFPIESTEDGFLLIGQSTIEGWPTNANTIIKALETFKEI